MFGSRSEQNGLFTRGTSNSSSSLFGVSQPFSSSQPSSSQATRSVSATRSRGSSPNHLGVTDSASPSPWGIQRPASSSGPISSPSSSTRPPGSPEFNFNWGDISQPNPFAVPGSSMSTPNNRSASGGLFASYRSPSEVSQQTRTSNNDSTPLMTPSPTPERNTDNGLRFGSSSPSQFSIANNLGRLDLNHLPNSHRSVSAGGRFPAQPQAYHYSAAENERLPVDLPYYNPAFQNTLKSGIRTAKDIASVLRRSPAACASDARLQSILQTAEDLSSFSAQAERRVAVVGKTGGGKSSLINALLDEKLAQDGNNGEAVTSFVTEYRYNRDLGRVVEIDYLHGAELDRELTELLDDYRRPHAPIPRNEARPADIDELHRMSFSAKKSLSKAFGHHNDWNVDQLKKFEPGSYQEALTNLRRWAQLIQWPDGVRNGRFTATAEGSQQVRGLISTAIPDAIWPFVKIVRVYLKAQILETGLVLADLPGLGDINFARVRAAQRYISQCDQIFIVSAIGRVVDDKDTFDILREHSRSSSQVGGATVTPSASIICTHAAAHNEDDRNANKHKVDQAKLREAEAQLRAANRGDGLVDERLKKVAQINRLSLYVKVKNREIEAKLREKHERLNISITIFFTDIKHYKKPVNETAVEISGIPRLREFCYRIRASALYTAANNFLDVSLRGLVRSLELWCEASTQAGTQLLQNQVDIVDMQNKIQDIKEAWEDSMLDHQDETISQSFRTHSRQIKTAGLETCQSWNSVAAQSYLAWCRHHGTHNTPAVGRKCWNSELINEMTDVMTNEWEDFFRQAQSGFDDWKKARESVNELCNQLRAANASPALTRLVRARNRAVRDIIKENYDSYMHRLGSLHRKATLGNRTSLILEQMAPVYGDCARDSGSGVTRRCQDRIYDHVANGDIYVNIHREIRSEIERIILSIADEVAQRIELVREQIHEDLTSVEVADDSLRDKYPALFEELDRVLPQAGRFVDSLRENN